MRPRRNRHHFHTFAFTDAEESVLRQAQTITGDNLTNTLMKALRTFLQEHNTRCQAQQWKPQSMWEQLAEFFNISP
ncbi:MAG: hypothetical protein ACW963_04980 [Candidatus Sifarchaeia archaeon]